MPDAAVVVMEMPPDPREARHGHEPAVSFAEEAHLLGEEREKFPLNAVPGV